MPHPVRTLQPLERGAGTSDGCTYLMVCDGNDRQIDDEDKAKANIPYSSDDSLLSHFVMCVIILNSLQMGFEQQWKPDANTTLEQVYFACDCIFGSVYVLEFILKFNELRCSYFKSMWNIIDFALTALSVFSVAAHLAHATQLEKANILRLLRFVRIMRLLRFVKAIPGLAVIVGGLAKALNGLTWLIVLLIGLFYVAAIFCCVTIGTADEYPEEFREVHFFADLAHAMMTLMDIAILAEWSSIVRPVMKYQPYLLPFFILFVLTSAMGMMNVIIGIIVDSTNEARDEVRSREKHERCTKSCQIWKDLIDRKGLSSESVARAKGSMSDEQNAEFEQHRQTAITEVLEKLLELDTINFPAGLQPEDVIALLDFDGSGLLDYDEFSTCLRRLILGDSFQLTCLILTVLGKVRKEGRLHCEDVKQSNLRNYTGLTQHFSKLESRLEKLESGQEEISAYLKALNDHFNCKQISP